jgi:alginate O-acetyltransferase complex protein AlgI
LLFNSLAFLVFFPIVVVLHFALPQRYRWLLLLVASYVFYAWWRVEYALLILLSTVVDYLVGRRLGSEDRPNARKALLAVSLTLNLGMLFVFKYYGFFADAARDVSTALGMSYAAPALNLVLPVGISFYTFQTLSYTIDVYRRKCHVEPHFGRFALFVAFFPQLVAGPIERASNLLHQFRRPTSFQYERVRGGLQQMIRGMFKKVVIADRLGVYVDAVYADPAQFEGLPLIVATYFFAFQIYADFSGYSDMAIGAARILGYDLMENFRRPYLAKSVSDFWRRWHISLSTWFRDYVYIPIGGNRGGMGRWFFNLYVTFVVSGLWHGANWTFLVWGALHGSYLVGGIVLTKLTGELPSHGVWDRFRTFHLALFAWVFFRAESISDAMAVFTRSILGLQEQLSWVIALDLRMLDRLFVVPTAVSRLDFGLSLVLIAGLWFHEALIESGREIPAGWPRRLAYDALVILILLFGFFDNTQFIYFQF